MNSQLFLTNNRLKIEDSLLNFINSQVGFLSPVSLKSPRAIGDAIQELVSANIERILESDKLSFQSNFARRGMADLAIQDDLGINYIVDVKTHNLNTDFNMPNLTSVKRLSDLYKSDDKKFLNYFVLMFFAYEIIASSIKVKQVYFIPIENLSWECLTIGALGWGQIQIANANKIILDTNLTRTEWMLGLCSEIEKFYPNEINKINERIRYFQLIREYWEYNQ